MTKIVNIGEYIEILTKKIEEMSKTYGNTDPAVETLSMLRDSLMSLPELESSKESYTIFLCGEWVCTYCGHEEKRLQNYCPECGRKLKGEKKNK